MLREAGGFPAIAEDRSCNSTDDGKPGRSVVSGTISRTGDGQQKVILRIRIHPPSLHTFFTLYKLNSAQPRFSVESCDPDSRAYPHSQRQEPTNACRHLCAAKDHNRPAQRTPEHHREVAEEGNDAAYEVEMHV